MFHLYDCFASSAYARRTEIKHVERVSRSVQMVTLECTAYRAAVRDNEWPTTCSIALESGCDVLFVPLGAVLPCETAVAWNILWHCESTVDALGTQHGRQESDPNLSKKSAFVRVVARRVGKEWSLAAVSNSKCAAAPTACWQDGTSEHTALPSTLVRLSPGLRNRNGHATDSRLAIVDLLLNRTLLRTLLHSRVAVYMLPHLQSDCVRVLHDHAQRYDLLTVQSSAGGTMSAQSFIFDAKTRGEDDCLCHLSAQQLERLLRRSPNIVDAALLPTLTQGGSTLWSFVAQNEQRLAQGTIRRDEKRAYSASDSAECSQGRFRGYRPSGHSTGLLDVSDSELHHFAQRLLALVDAIAPCDACGILVRPYDLQTTALVEQECPYMMHNIAAFVPAASRFR